MCVCVWNQSGWLISLLWLQTLAFQVSSCFQWSWSDYHTHTHTHTGIRMPPLLSPSSISHTLPIESVGPSDPPRLNGRSNAHSSAGVRSPTISVCVCTLHTITRTLLLSLIPLPILQMDLAKTTQPAGNKHCTHHYRGGKVKVFGSLFLLLLHKIKHKIKAQNKKEAQNKGTEWMHMFTQCWWVFKGQLHLKKKWKWNFDIISKLILMLFQTCMTFFSGTLFQKLSASSKQ